MRCASVTAPSAHVALSVSISRQRNSDTSTLPSQNFCISLICWRIMFAVPSRASAMLMTRTAATVIVRFRLRPVAASLTTRLIRMASLRVSACVAVDAASLVTDKTSVFKLDDTTTHLVDDVGVVGGHDDGGPRSVDAI